MNKVAQQSGVEGGGKICNFGFHDQEKKSVTP